MRRLRRLARAITSMKNLTTALLIVLLAIVATLLWRLEQHAVPLAELARVQLADREENRRNEQARRVVAEREQAEARAKAEADAAAAELRARTEAARSARQIEPVKPGEVVPEIILDNHETVRDAVVIAVQGTSVSFKVGARLYNIPTEQLPAELRARIRRMFPASAEAAAGPSAAPAAQP